MIPEEDKIVITEWGYKIGADNVINPEMVYKNVQLSDAICDYYKRVLEEQGVEVFKHEWNIIATSKKFYGAFFEKDLKHSE